MNPAAHDAFLLGESSRWKSSVADLRRAVVHYQRATALEPDYAQAYSSLSLAWGQLNDENAGALARETASRALKLDANLPEAHAAMAVALYRDWDWEGGDRESLRAIALSPGALDSCYCYALALNARGRFADALRLADQAILDNPLAGGAHFMRGTILYSGRRFDEAIAALRRGIEIDPTHLPNHRLLAYAHMANGQAADAVRIVEQPPFQGSLDLALVYAVTGRHADAVRLLHPLVVAGQRPEAWRVAQVYLALGDQDSGLNWFERAVDSHEVRAAIVVGPTFDTVREAPRFRALVARLGLPRDLGTLLEARAHDARPGSDGR